MQSSKPLRAILLLAALSAACGSDAHESKGGGPQGLELGRDGVLVTIDPADQACKVDDDCALVPIGCNGCCQTGAISSRLESDFGPAFAEVCDDYSGPVCDCDAPAVRASCVEGLCTPVPDEPIDLITPEQVCESINMALDEAYETATACTTDTECGRTLPTLGSCGCSGDRVGRHDADRAAIQSLLEQRDTLSNIRACSPVDGACGCDETAGVACVEGHCDWMTVQPSEPCAGLSDATFHHGIDLDCADEPGEPSPCHFTLTFGLDVVTWVRGAVRELSYKCTDGVLTTWDAEGEVRTGTISTDRVMRFEGGEYTLLD